MVISPYVRRLRLAAELRELREQAGVSAQDLAKRSGVYRQMISKLENAHVAPNQEDVQRLLDVLGVEGDKWTQLVQITAKATISVLPAWRKRQEEERLATGPEVWVDSGRVFTQADGRPLRPQWISTRFDDLIEKHGRVRRRHVEEGWAPDRIARRHRVSERAVQGRYGATHCHRSASMTCGTGRPRWRCSARWT